MESRQLGNVSFLKRLGGLSAGIVLGQGSIFLLQTLLMTSGRIAATVSFGFAYAVLTLVQWTADWGGLILQGRCRSEDLSCDRLWEMALGRLLVAPAIVACQLSFAFYYRGVDEFSSGMIMGGALIAPIWAFNVAGLLDANGKNALAGPLAGLPPALGAIAGCQLFGADFRPLSIGISAGIAYTVGCLVCVLGQILIAGTLTPLKWPRAVSLAGARRWLVEGAMYCAGEFPGHFYGRALLLIVTKTLGLHTAGIYVYIRQIISGSGQAILLIKRVEFPALRQVASNRPLHIMDVFHAQRAKFYRFGERLRSIPFRPDCSCSSDAGRRRSHASLLSEHNSPLGGRRHSRPSGRRNRPGSQLLVVRGCEYDRFGGSGLSPHWALRPALFGYPGLSGF